MSSKRQSLRPDVMCQMDITLTDGGAGLGGSPVSVFSFTPHHLWRTTTSSARSLRSSFPRTDMLCGSPVPRNCHNIAPWTLATLVSHAKADSTVFSMFSFPQTIHPTTSACQNIMSHSNLVCPFIFSAAHSHPAITVRLESTLWLIDQAFGHLGGYDNRLNF